MSSPGLSAEWRSYADGKNLPLPAKTIEEYRRVRAERGVIGQESLKQDAFKPLNELVVVQDLKISLPEVVGHIFPVRVYRPASQSSKKLPVMLYFHGGYWCGGDLNSEDLGCRAIIARGVEIVIVSFSYRSVMKVRWEAMLSDAEYAMKWLAANSQDLGGDTSLGFLVGGAEAGAHLAAVCAVRAKGTYPNIHLTGQALIVPTLIAWPDSQIPDDWLRRLRSHREQANAPVLNEELYEALVANLKIPDEVKRKGENFPMWASLDGLPPTYLAMDECDPTRDQSFLFESLLAKAGVKTRIDYYQGLPNMFVQFPDLLTTATAGFHLSAAIKWLLRPGPPGCRAEM